MQLISFLRSQFEKSVDWKHLRVELILFFLLLVIIYLWKRGRKTKKLPPGPYGVPLLGYLPFLGLEPCKTLLQLSKKYGSKIIGLRFGSRYTVVLNDFETTKEVLCHTSALDRATHQLGHLQELGFSGRNGEPWQEQRRYTMQSTRDLGLGRGHWEELVQEEINIFLEYLASTKGEPTNVFAKMKRALSNNILSLLIGRRLREGEEDKMKLCLDYADVALTFTGPSSPVTLVPGLRSFFERFKIAGYDKALEIIINFRKFTRSEVIKHKNSSVGNNGSDFISLYLESMEEILSKGKNKHHFSDDMLEGNVNSMFLGGSDTGYTSLGWLFLLMASRPDVQKKVQDELDEVLGADGVPSYHERSKVPYTFAVIMEAQRYHSIVPLGPTRVAASDIQIQGYTIPKGAEIISNFWALHHDPKYWEEPEKFKPERFLTKDSELIKNPPSYIPFSIGKRDCPGQTIAWMAILAFFTAVVKKFTIEVPPGPQPKYEIIHGLVEHLKPLPFCFIQRKK